MISQKDIRCLMLELKHLINLLSIMNWIRRIMNKLFIDNESFDIDEDDITLSQIKNRIYVNGKLISEVNNDSVHISFTGNVKELNCNTCDIDGNALTVHGNSVKVKGNVGGSIEANSIEVGGDVEGDITANSVKVRGKHTGSISM